jgi:Nif-specific regulatory protein
MQARNGQNHSRLASFIDVTQRLIGVTEPEELLGVILESVLRLFAVEACSIALIDDTEQHLTFAFTLGGAKIEEVRLPLGQGIIGWVAQTGQGVVCNDVTQDPRFFKQIDRQTGFRTKTILCAPLRHDHKIIGAIEALNTTVPDGFSTEDLELLRAFGTLATAIIHRTEMFVRVRNAKEVFQQAVQDRYQLISGPSIIMQEVLQIARRVAPASTTVLLLGESGTGKEVVARAIHQWSPRADQPFVAVNCVALTPELLESELFGHEKGAFTGAIAQKKGKFELAHGGTIFLDEIGDLVPNLQAKLLRALQDKRFQRVGGERDIHVDVRILAATNRDLRQAMHNGTFREDLYYRLNVVPITLPPLRDRKEDIPTLVEHFIARYCSERKCPRMGIDTAAMMAIQSYSWPGNVRELQNVIERAVVLSSQAMITLTDLPAEIRNATVGHPQTVPQPLAIDTPSSLAEAMIVFQRTKVRQALDVTGGNQTKAAQLLGLPRANLSKLMKKLGLR